jgi:2-polyprenyl-6-methoxyphenol hydroxylase-like FAD-dependent oxidoreductase
MTTHDRPRVLISGAGIAGLAAALRFRQIGWEPLVVEQAPSRRSNGYLINISPAGHEAAQRLGILPALEKQHVDLREFVYVNASGRRKFAVPQATVTAMLGQPHITLLRGDLEAALYQAVHDQAEIRFGTQIQAITPHATGVHAALSDATTVAADLLVAADGLHSRVRALAFGPRQRFWVALDDIVVAAFLPRRPPDGVGEHTAAMLTEPGRTAVVANLGAGRSAALLTYRSADPAADLADGPHPAATRAYRESGWLLPELLDQLGRAESVYFDSATQVRADRWSRGRVVLLGDAAWCLTLFAGAGASLALTGADLLGAALARHPDVPTALAAWETELRPQVDSLQRAGRRNAAQRAPNSRLQVWSRDLLLRAATLPPVARILQRQLRLHR